MSQESFESEVKASDILRSNMRDFARHTAREYIANEVDGLKLVHRRILQAIEHGTKKYKEASLIGETMKEYHPHGDGAIKDAIDRLAQPFNQQCPLITGVGNVGAYSGGVPAAARYLDIMISQFSEDVFFKYTNLRTLNYVPKEDVEGVELAYFIPAVPMTLIMGPSSILVAYRSNIPYYNFTDICNLVVAFIKERKKHPQDYLKRYKVYAKYLIPDFPVKSMLLNSRQILEEYEKGNFNCKFITCGTMDVVPTTINIRSIPFGIDFYKTVKLKLQELGRKASFVTANYQDILDLTNETSIGNVELPMKRGVSPFADMNVLKKEILFKQSWSPIWNFSTADGYMTVRNPIELLEIWYQERCRSIVADLKLTNMDVVNEYRKITALIIIYDHAKEVAELFLNAKCKEDTVEPLAKRYNLSLYQAKFIASLQISQFTAQGKDELLQKLESVKARLKEIQNKFLSVDDIIIEQVTKLRDKYTGSVITRRTKVPDFIGAIKINDDGYIQFSDLQEMNHILNRWGDKASCSILWYPKYKDNFSRPFNMFMREGKAFIDDKELDFQKELVTSQLYFADKKAKYSIVTHKDGTISRINGVLGTTEPKSKVIYVDKELTAINHSWQMVKVNADEVPTRVNITAQGIKTDWKYLSDTVCTDSVIVVHMNTKDPNTVIFERKKPGEKITRQFFGSTVILGIFNDNDTFCQTIPEDLLNRCSYKSLLIGSTKECANLGQFMGNNDKVIIYMNKKSTSVNGLNMKGLEKVSSVLIPTLK